MTIILIALFLSLILSGFFSGMEMAFVTANKLQIELDKQKGTWAGRQISRFVKDPSRFINTILVGNNICLVIFGLMSAKLLEPFLYSIFPQEWLVLLVQTIVTTLIVLLFGEFLPKAFFRVYANPVLRFFIVPFFALYVLLYLIAGFFAVISSNILRLFGVPVTAGEQQFSPVDLQEFIHEHSVLEDQDREIDTDLFENALYFRDTKVRECMIPRTEMIAVDASASLEEIRQEVIDTHHSRIPVYKDNIDNIIGYIHHFHLLLKSGSVEQILMPLRPVTETTPAHELLSQFINEAQSIAYVVDEYGGTAGLVTLEDLLEEIFGEIQDEHDDERVLARQIGDYEYVISGRFEVDKLNSEFELDIPEGEYETISGFILMYHNTIPALHDIIEVEQFTFTILEVTEKKIETVKLMVDPEHGNIM